MGFLQNTLTTELVANSASYTFDGAGGMRDQLEQTIFQELENKQYPLKYTIETVKSGGLFGTKEQCISIETAQGHRVVISNTTVGTYLYVGIYHLIRVLNTVNQISAAFTITDIFAHQHSQAAYSAVIAASESAFTKLQLKQMNTGYRPVISGPMMDE